MPPTKQTPQSSGPTTRMGAAVITPEMEKDLMYYVMTKDELQAELETRGLPKTGNKDELIERLQESD